MNKTKEMQQKIRTEEAVQYAEDLSAVMQTCEGRRLLLGIVASTGLFEPAPASADVERYIGRRDFGLHLRRNMMLICPTETQKGLEEEYERKKHNAARLRATAECEAKEEEEL